MSSIQLFKEANCGGESVVVTKDTKNLADHNFVKCAKSLLVTGDPWVVYSDNLFEGKFCLYRAGGHNSLGEFSEQISSLRFVKGGLNHPEITVYEDSNYKGQTMKFMKSTPSLRAAGMEKTVSSYKCKSGAWRLYQEEDFQCTVMVALAGDEVPDLDLLNWDNKLVSLMPY